MFAPRYIARQTALVLAALILSAGCSNMPTGPRPGPDSAFAPDAGSAAPAGANPMPIAQVRSVQTSKIIYGAFGGTVTAGNFTVVMPPLAVSGSVTVTVTQPDREKPYVELSISPASANKFRTPVTLIATAPLMSAVRLQTACISWYNPETKAWEPMSASTVNLAGATIACPLSHFSTYRVESGGKAGW